MKTDKEQRDDWAKLNMTEKSNMEGLVKEIEAWLSNFEDISIEGFYELRGIVDTLTVYQGLYLEKVLHLLKQGYQLD